MQNAAIEEAVKEPQVNKDEKKLDQAVPYSRFNEVVKERNELKSKMENINLEQEEQRKNSLAEQGEYKTLLTEEQNKNVELSKQFEEISTAFKAIAAAEKVHEDRYRKLLENLMGNKVFEREDKVFWYCRKCGYVHFGTKPLKNCPACLHPASYAEVLADNY